jgi:hypothetical protein
MEAPVCPRHKVDIEVGVADENTKQKGKVNGNNMVTGPGSHAEATGASK